MAVLDLESLSVLGLIEPDAMEAWARAPRMGAEDRLGRPFALQEFRARVEALGRPLSSRCQSICQPGSLTMELINDATQG
jgi:DNA-binding response OmpR family regulator